MGNTYHAILPLGGDEMNKSLLVWNIVLAIILMGTAFNACSATDPRYELYNEKYDEKLRILTDAVNQHSQAIGANNSSIRNNRELALELHRQISQTPLHKH